MGNTKMNPYTVKPMEQFDKDDTLPPIETMALKKYNDNETERKIREKFLKSKVNRVEDIDDEDDGKSEGWNKISRKRSERSPLMSETNKKVKESARTNEAIERFLSRRRNKEDSEEDEEDESEAEEDDVFNKAQK